MGHWSIPGSDNKSGPARIVLAVVRIVSIHQTLLIDFAPLAPTMRRIGFLSQVNDGTQTSSRMTECERTRQLRRTHLTDCSLLWSCSVVARQCA